MQNAADEDGVVLNNEDNDVGLIEMGAQWPLVPFAQRQRLRVRRDKPKCAEQAVAIFVGLH